MTRPTISFEYFPPKTEKAEQAFWEAIPKLEAFEPEFMTVTYGAGGSTKEKTLDTACALTRKTDIPIAAHLTFINTPKRELYDLTTELWDRNIRHLIALRGDMPDDLQWPLDPDQDYFQYTSDFVAGLRTQYDFEISVGAYPEKHPDSLSLEDDIYALKMKFDSGADRGITQFFFDNECYYAFLDACEKAGITGPVCPGLLPIHDFTRMCSFAGRCQATVPQWLHDKFEKLSDPEDAQKLARDLLAEQAQDLVANGVSHIHFYTLNKAEITAEVCEQLGYKAQSA